MHLHHFGRTTASNSSENYIFEHDFFSYSASEFVALGSTKSRFLFIWLLAFLMRTKILGLMFFEVFEKQEACNR